MIFGELAAWESCVEDSPRMRQAFLWLQEQGPDLAPGRYELDGEKLFVNVDAYTTKPMEEGLYEAHERYIDIQVLFRGEERIKCRDAAGLTVKTPYSLKTDCVFYEGGEDGVEPFVLVPGAFAVFLPEDVHMPCRHPESGPTEVLKAVVKVRIG